MDEQDFILVCIISLDFKPKLNCTISSCYHSRTKTNWNYFQVLTDKKHSTHNQCWISELDQTIRHTTSVEYPSWTKPFDTQPVLNIRAGPNFEFLVWTVQLLRRQTCVIRYYSILEFGKLRINASFESSRRMNSIIWWMITTCNPFHLSSSFVIA